MTNLDLNQIEKLKARGFELYNIIGQAQQELQHVIKQLSKEEVNIAPIKEEPVE